MNRQLDLKVPSYDLSIFFDGACTRVKGRTPMGAYAFVVLNSKNEELYNEAGAVTLEDRITNNLSEAYAISKAMIYL